MDNGDITSSELNDDFISDDTAVEFINEILPRVFQNAMDDKSQPNPVLSKYQMSVDKLKSWLILWKKEFVIC